MGLEEDGTVQAGTDLLALHAHFQGERLAPLGEIREVGAAGENMHIVDLGFISLQVSQLPCKVKTKLKSSLPSSHLLFNDKPNTAPIALGLYSRRSKHNVTSYQA